MKIKLGLMATCLVIAGAYGCGSDSESKDGDKGGGSADSSSFTVEVSGNSGSSTKKAEQKDEQAGASSWGATISGELLTLFLVDPDGTAVTALVKTSESAKAPGTFAVGSEHDDITVTMLNPVLGNAFTSIGEGTIKLDNCPRAMGEHVRGSFSNIKLQGELGGNAVETLSGSFDVVVYAKAGDLFCEPVQTGNNNVGPGGKDNNSQPGVCAVDLCDEGGTCCPYMECMAECEYSCFMEECIMNPASPACLSCTSGCLNSCGVSNECRVEMGKLVACEETHGCDEIEDEDEGLECSKAHCCSELNAVY